MTRKFTIPYIEKCLSDRHIKWLNKEEGYQNRKTRMKLECIKCNYIWCPQFKSIEQNKGCPKCNGKAKYTILEVQKILKDRNIIWKDSENGYSNNWKKLKFQCADKKCRHLWCTSFGSIKDGNSGCPMCANCVKYTNKEINNILNTKNIAWLDQIKEYKNIREKIKLKCLTCGFIWYGPFRSIKNSKYGCHRCAGREKYTSETVNKILNAKNITWIGQEKEYQNNHTLLKLQCKKINCNRIWKAHFASINNGGSGCPYCSTCKTEKLCRKYLEQKFQTKFPKVSPAWLHFSVTNGLQLDGFNKRLKLAFEYNGEQHYKINTFFHQTKEDFKSQQKRDKLKRKILKQRGIKLLDIPYTYSCQNESKLYKFIDDQLIKLKII